MLEQGTDQSNDIEPQRKTWEKPEMIEVSISDVTSSLYAVGGNDGTPSLSNVS